MSPNTRILDSLKHYIGGPTYADKKKYNETMFNSSKAEEKEEAQPPPKMWSVISPKVPASKPVELKVAQVAPEDQNNENV